jgi:ankyrin repeat protein
VTLVGKGFKASSPSQLQQLALGLFGSILQAQAQAQIWLMDLHAAVQLGQTAEVQQLLDVGGVDLDALSSGWRTALHVAAQCGNTDIVATLLAAGANPNRLPTAPPFIGSPLQAAVQYNHLPVVQQLLAAGAAVNARDAMGRTALLLAAKHKRAAMVAPLLAAGADPNLKDSQGYSVLLMAAQHGQLSTVRQLLAAGAVAKAASKRSMLGASTPLHQAAAKCHTAVVQLLLDHGLHGDCADSGGKTALDCAAAAGAPVELLQLLLAKSAEPAAAASRALIAAAGAKSTSADAVAYLLAQGADVTAAGPAGTALHAAAAVGNADAVQLLLQAGAEHSAISEQRSMPLCGAASGGHLRVVQQLLAAGAAVDAPGAAHPNNPLLLAANSGHVAVAEALIAAGAAVNRVSQGWTPVLAAVRSGHAACVRLLLQSGANPNLGNLKLALARDSGPRGAVQVLCPEVPLAHAVEALRVLLSWTEPAVDLETVLDAADIQQDLAPVLLCHVAEKDPEAAAEYLSERVRDYPIEAIFLQPAGPPGLVLLQEQQWWQCAGKYLAGLTRDMLKAWVADKAAMDVQWDAVVAKEREAVELCAQVRQLAVAVALGTEQQQSQQQAHLEW